MAPASLRLQSVGDAGTRDRLPPARGAKSTARGIVTERPRRQSPHRNLLAAR